MELKFEYFCDTGKCKADSGTVTTNWEINADTLINSDIGTRYFKSSETLNCRPHWNGIKEPSFWTAD
jgi:hypothetical protein